jgi:hypothetical protein
MRISDIFNARLLQRSCRIEGNTVMLMSSGFVKEKVSGNKLCKGATPKFIGKSREVRKPEHNWSSK